jgi:hypothetical protein
VFFGAADLDTAPATPGVQVAVGRIWCQAGTELSAELTVHPSDGMRAADVSFSVASPTGGELIAGMRGARGKVAESGWHTLRVDATEGTRGSAAYELAVTYFGTGSL